MKNTTISWRKKATIVTSAGKIIHHGNQGVIIVDDKEHKEILSVAEVSDDDVVDVFVNIADGANLMTPGASASNGDMVSDAEIIIDRSIHKTYIGE